jgi:hypothetical protein
VSVLKNLLTKSGCVEWGGDGRVDYYCVILRSGLTAGAEAFAEENDVILFDLAYMKRVSCEKL